jgi:hypothetical protein
MSRLASMCGKHKLIYTGFYAFPCTLRGKGAVRFCPPNPVTLRFEVLPSSKYFTALSTQFRKKPLNNIIVAQEILYPHGAVRVDEFQKTVALLFYSRTFVVRKTLICEYSRPEQDKQFCKQQHCYSMFCI